MTAPDAMRVFDRRLVRLRRDRAAASAADHGFLFEHVAAALADRLLDIRRDFAVALSLGGRAGALARAMGPHGRIRTLIEADLSPKLAALAARATDAPALALDEEALPFAAESLDLVLSDLTLHWVNDLPGALLQIRRALKPDGLFLAAMLGGSTLAELRAALVEAEIAVSGGVSPRLSPYAELRDAAGLLQRAGFALPVADSERVTATYDSAFRLFADLRGMGETAAGLERNPLVPPRRLWAEAAERYAARFALPDGRIPATFELLFLSGWAPHESQQKPLRPGSAQHRLADALGTVEQSTGVRVDRKR